MGGTSTSTPPFLARRTYRQRRLRDAIKMLPVAGVVLWLLPLAAQRPTTSSTGIYIFGLWVGLILVAAALASRLRTDPELGETPDGGEIG